MPRRCLVQRPKFVFVLVTSHLPSHLLRWISLEVASRSTGTDADDIVISRGGVPTVLISLPLKYMHTAVETISLDTLEECARLLAHFVSELDASWEDDLWI